MEIALLFGNPWIRIKIGNALFMLKMYGRCTEFEMVCFFVCVAAHCSGKVTSKKSWIIENCTLGALYIKKSDILFTTKVEITLHRVVLLHSLKVHDVSHLSPKWASNSRKKFGIEHNSLYQISILDILEFQSSQTAFFNSDISFGDFYKVGAKNMRIRINLN